MSEAATTPWGPVVLEEGAADGTRERILDAALERFSQHGISATTMSQIAADVGISRVWLYRYFDNRDAVVRAVLAREASRFLADLVGHIDLTAPAADIVIDAFDHVVAGLRAHPLIGRVLLTEADVMTPYLAGGTGPVLRIGADVATGFLREHAGLAAADARAVAETLLRLVLSAVINNGTTTDFDDARQRRAFARRIIPRLLGA